MILGGSYFFWVVIGIVLWLLVVLGGSWLFLVVCDGSMGVSGDYWWFLSVVGFFVGSL